MASKLAVDVLNHKKSNPTSLPVETLAPQSVERKNNLMRCATGL